MSSPATARSHGAPPAGPARGPEVVADFLRDVRYQVEAGADPLAAAQRAALELPVRVRSAIEAVIARLRGDYHEDEFGFDERLAEAIFGLVELGYDLWWRGGVAGVRNVPAHGGALLVVNRAPLPAPIAAGLVATALMKRHPLPRWPRFPTADAILSLPFVSTAARRCGAVPSGAQTTVGLLERGELVCCFDERGFAELAACSGAPIIPVAIVDTPARLIEFRAPIRP